IRWNTAWPHSAVSGTTFPERNRNGRTTNGTNTSNQRRTMPTTNDELRVLWIAAITFPPNSCSPCAASGLTVTGASSFLRLRLEAEERSCRRDVRPGCSIEQPDATRRERRIEGGGRASVCSFLALPRASNEVLVADRSI